MRVTSLVAVEMVSVFSKEEKIYYKILLYYALCD